MTNCERKAAQTAYEMIRDGMVVGLGNGNCVWELIHLLKENPKDISVSPVGTVTKRLCRECGLKVIDSRFLDHVDLFFDNCDEIDYSFNILKSSNGSHTRAKILADMADEYILFCDEAKFFPRLRFRQPVCLEVLQPALSSVIRFLRNRGVKVCVCENEEQGKLLLSDDGNYMLNLRLPPVENLSKLNRDLNDIPGIVEHSLFVNMIDKVILLTHEDVRVLQAPVVPV